MTKIHLRPLTTFHDKKIKKNTIVFDRRLRKYCVSCINFKKNPLCPPQFPYSERLLSYYTKFRLVYVKLDFAKYKKLREKDHPNWSDKQLGNSRHWQSSLKVLLRRHISQFFYKDILTCGSGLLGHGSMEAGGCNVFETCENNGIYLEGKFLKPIERYIHLVTLLMS
jgi:predicted metal-binding protein